MLRDRSNDEAFNVFYRKYYKQMYYSAYSITRDHYLAQDVVQETFIKAYRHFDTLKMEGKKGAWLYVISRNTAIDFYRKRLRCLEISDDNVELNAGVSAEGEERYIEMNLIRELLLTLEPQHRQMLLLIYEYGLTYEQLAAYQNTSVSAVKSRIYRVKVKLRSMARKMEESL